MSNKMTCRFEIQIKDVGCFHCAADVHGWAYLWWHDGLRDPCPCKKKIEGKPLVVDHELKSAEFWAISGKRIRGQDWEEWKRR